MAGSARVRLPAARFLGHAGRALLFAALVVVLEQIVHLLTARWWPAEPMGTLAAYTAGTLVAALLTGSLLIRLLDGRGPAALGIALSRQVPRELAIGWTAGVVPQLAIALPLLLGGGLAFAATRGSVGEWVGSLTWSLVVLLIAAAAEEAVYRGYGFQALLRGFGTWPTLLFTSALFTYAHGRNPAVTPFALGNIFLAGIVLGLAYLRTLSLWLVTALHTGWNWSMAGLLDLPVSGLGLIDTPLYEPVLSAPPWLAGGAFGPEGGLLGTVALLLAVLIVWGWPRVGPSPAQRAARPLPLSSEEQEPHE